MSFFVFAYLDMWPRCKLTAQDTKQPVADPTTELEIAGALIRNVSWMTNLHVLKKNVWCKN